MISKLFKQIFRHKLITGIILLLIISGGYFGYQKLTGDKNTAKYITATIKKDILIISVSGSGQVSVSNQVDIKPKVSGDVVYVGVKNGQEIKAGVLIAQLDTRDAQKAVQGAEVNLADAELTLKNTKGKAEESLATAYENGFNVLTETFKDLSPTMSSIKDIFATLLKSSYSSEENDIDYYQRLVRLYNGDSADLSYWGGGAESKYLNVQAQFDSVQKEYWAISQSSPYNQIDIVLNQTCDITKTLLELVQQANNLIEQYQSLVEKENLMPPISINTSNGQVSQLSDFRSLIVKRVDALSTAKLSLVDKKEAVDKAKLDIETQYLAVEQAEHALSDAKENLSQHYICAPFDGIIAEVNSDIKAGDSILTNTVLATIITKQKIAEISLNEIDVAKIKIGQKANITFDSIEGLNITGEVVEADTLGQVSQGVVTYGVEIAFDTQDERIKPGMSLSVVIITAAKQNALLVPNSAVEQQGGIYYMQVVDDAAAIESNQAATNVSGVIIPASSLRAQQVQVGLSNDIATEIISGLKEGDIVVTRTISSNSNTTQNQSQSNQGQMFKMMR